MQIKLPLVQVEDDDEDFFDLQEDFSDDELEEQIVEKNMSIEEKMASTFEDEFVHIDSMQFQELSFSNPFSSSFSGISTSIEDIPKETSNIVEASEPEHLLRDPVKVQKEEAVKDTIRSPASSSVKTIDINISSSTPERHAITVEIIDAPHYAGSSMQTLHPYSLTTSGPSIVSCISIPISMNDPVSRGSYSSTSISSPSYVECTDSLASLYSSTSFANSSKYVDSSNDNSSYAQSRVSDPYCFAY